MKRLLAICLMMASPLAWTDEIANVTGKIVEVKNVESYTYLRLITLEGETWAAINKSPVKKGSTVTIENVSVMNNFESKTLKKTFPTILFGTLANPAGNAQSGHFMGSAYPVFSKNPPAANTPKAGSGNVQLLKGSGENAHTVEEIMSHGAAFKDKPVLVRGKVVKYTSGVMGKNWVHLQDGSGTAASKTDDIIVISPNETKIGDVITAKGIVRTDKDVGIGIIYKVVIEGTLQ